MPAENGETKSEEVILLNLHRYLEFLLVNLYVSKNRLHLSRELYIDARYETLAACCMNLCEDTLKI